MLIITIIAYLKMIFNRYSSETISIMCLCLAVRLNKSSRQLYQTKRINKYFSIKRPISKHVFIPLIINACRVWIYRAEFIASRCIPTVYRSCCVVAEWKLYLHINTVL